MNKNILALLLISLGIITIAWGFSGLMGYDHKMIAFYYQTKSRILNQPILESGFKTYSQPLIDPNQKGVEFPPVAPPISPQGLEHSIATSQPQGTAQPIEEQPVAENRNPVDPTRIVIPVIDLDAPIILAAMNTVWENGYEFTQWEAPDEYAVGWHENSARLGEIGNTVLNGHHNAYGEVFRDLEKLKRGDRILVSGGEDIFRFEITNIMILPEKTVRLEKRMENAQWTFPSLDERLTLITCWPYETNTHRLLIVARPIN